MSTVTPWVPVVAAALLAGAAGGAVGRYAAPAMKPPRTTSVSPEVADPGALTQRIGELEDTVRRLERGQQMARVVAALGSVAAPSAGGTDDGARAATVDNPVFQAAVRDVVDQMELERRGEREARFEERRRQGAEQWSASLGEKLGLSEAQRQKVTDVMMDFSREMRAARSSDAGSPSRDEWRQRAAAARQKGEDKLGQILDPTQRQKYDTLDDEEKLGSGRGGRFRGQ